MKDDFRIHKAASMQCSSSTPMLGTIMMHSLRIPIAIMMAAAASALAVGPAHASSVIYVSPGQSIQAAVDSAQPGDTVQLMPGTYHESVTISTNDVTLRGAGSGPNGSVLLPPSVFPNNACATVPPDEPAPLGGGICIFGSINSAGQVTYLSGVRVTNIQVSGFAVDISSVFTDGTQIDHATLLNASHYGVTGIISKHLLIASNIVKGAQRNGIYVGNYGVSQSDSLVTGNDVSDSHYAGISVRDSQGVAVTQNSLHGNCAGYMGWDDTGDPVPVGGDQITVSGNSVTDNNEVCAPLSSVPGFPALQGTGIILTGVTKTTVTGNQVTGNNGTGPLAGGIVVVQQNWLAPDQIEGDDTVSGNTVNGNGPYDLRWDQQGTGIAFTGNQCATSSPGGLCS